MGTAGDWAVAWRGVGVGAARCWDARDKHEEPSGTRPQWDPGELSLETR